MVATCGYRRPPTDHRQVRLTDSWLALPFHRQSRLERPHFGNEMGDLKVHSGSLGIGRSMTLVGG